MSVPIRQQSIEGTRCCRFHNRGCRDFYSGCYRCFAKVVKLLSDAGENVEYAYAFLTPEEGHAYVIFRVDNNEKACEHLKENGVDVIEENSLL